MAKKNLDFGPKPKPVTLDEFVGVSDKSRLTIDIDRQLHIALKTYCAAHEVSMADVVREAIQARLSK